MALWHGTAMRVSWLCGGQVDQMCSVFRVWIPGDVDGLGKREWFLWSLVFGLWWDRSDRDKRRDRRNMPGFNVNQRVTGANERNLACKGDLDIA